MRGLVVFAKRHDTPLFGSGNHRRTPWRSFPSYAFDCLLHRILPGASCTGRTARTAGSRAGSTPADGEFSRDMSTAQSGKSGALIAVKPGVNSTGFWTLDGATHRR